MSRPRVLSDLLLLTGLSCRIGTAEILKTPHAPYELKLMGWKSGRGQSWRHGTRGRKESLAPARVKHQGSCFGLSFLATLSVGSAARGRGYCRHQCVDGSTVTYSLCSSSRSEPSSCALSTAPSSLLTGVLLFSFCVKFLSDHSCSCFLSAFPFLPFPQPQMSGLDIRVPRDRNLC